MTGTLTQSTEAKPAIDWGPLHGPLAVKPKRACEMLGCGMTRLYELINSGELEAYRDGSSRMITVRSILARVERLLAASQSAA